ncbi:hypothetical protein RhiXN_12055 [Rhizoctonia solani]|uniref:Uncharacterized protein n=1 Tax=Rhizoctonia solani TaxID=456999 RepID=A0A8H8T2J0_9AGAM|nr:uncharacterized protein RhiXN_12055 [Rhizoctonia solani]QRW26394.1 hypothetical protein RhiXN_12055 [Rhizoctonia solani]
MNNISKILKCKTTNVDGTHKATGTARAQLFGWDCTIEWLRIECSILQERCHQLEQQANSLTMAMAVYGIPMPKGALGAAGGPSNGNALASFLCEHLPAINPAVAGDVICKTPEDDSMPTPNCPCLAFISNHTEPDNINPTLCEDMDHNFVEEASKVFNMPPSSKVTISKKGKPLVHSGF